LRGVLHRTPPPKRKGKEKDKRRRVPDPTKMIKNKEIDHEERKSWLHEVAVKAGQMT